MADRPYGGVKNVKKQTQYNQAKAQQLEEIKQEQLRDPHAPAPAAPEMNFKLPQEAQLLNSLGKIAYTLDKTYLSQLETGYGILSFHDYNRCISTYKDASGKEIEQEDEIITYESNIRALQVNQWVYDKDEKIGDCFKNVLSVFAGSGETLALVLHRTKTGTKMYFVTKNSGLGQNSHSTDVIGLLASSLRGNFPGSAVKIVGSDIKGPKAEDLFSFQNMKAVACLCNMPSERGEEEYLCQGIDKLLNGLVPGTEIIPDQEYYIVIMATPLSVEEQREILHGYEELATALTPFAGYQFQAGKNENHVEGVMNTLARTDGISEAITKTHSINAGLNAGVNGSFASLLSKAVTAGRNKTSTLGGSVNVVLVGAHYDRSKGSHTDASLSQGTTRTYGGNIGMSLGYGYSWGRTEGRNSNVSLTDGSNRSISLGVTENTTYSYKSYLVNDLLKKLEEMIKRITESQSMGLWKTASYVFSEQMVTSKSIAHYLRSLIQGDNSYMEPAVIQAWMDENANGLVPFKEIRKYLSHFTHPVFVSLTDENMKQTGNDSQLRSDDNIFVTPTSNVCTTELANTFAFPRHSVQGIPVIQCARFGREPHSLESLNGEIRLGQTYHMHQTEDNHSLSLGKRELTAHTFITGSTGAGKSNTIYKILDELCFQDKNPAKFLVIEPAKGEYKNVFGGRKDVLVYGTNPKKTPLLRMNPFSFPDDIHVLEHIDRLVEVFNACWPMYAAMPAVLKDAIEASYVSCGWSLSRSICATGQFPTFATLLKKLPEIMESSAYSKDTKGDYTGALVARIKSLTNGINGQIFCSFEEIADEDLFDKNIIVDLSRVGSMETKALLMGMLMIKLQEYRMAEAKGSNTALRHITVLEEAHNLLRRTASEQSQESSNLQGKSVEMLANAIAEMRTYGEGFIIADQAPGLLDMAVIRNTNTKIIMRLPDESDRQLVGKAAGLNDDQIMELSRLDVGVAAVFQNHWLEPVLCKVDQFDDMEPFSYQPPEQTSSPDMDALFTVILNEGKDGAELSAETVDRLKQWTEHLDTGKAVKKLLYRVLENNADLSNQDKRYLLYCLVKGKTLVEQAEKEPKTYMARAMVEQTIMDTLHVSAELAEEIAKSIFMYAASQVEKDIERHQGLLDYVGVI